MDMMNTMAKGRAVRCRQWLQRRAGAEQENTAENPKAAAPPLPGAQSRARGRPATGLTRVRIGEQRRKPQPR